MGRILLYLMLAIVVLTVISALIALIIATVTLAIVAVAIGIPLWLAWRSWAARHGLTARARTSVERLQELYIEGKIDLFEFERRVAGLIAVEK